MAPLGEDQEAPEIDLNFNTTAPTGEMILTIVDSAGKPVPRIRTHGTTISEGVKFHSFGISDAAGQVRMVCLDGDWKIHLSDTNLREKGFVEVAELELKASGAQSTLIVPISRFADLVPGITSKPAAPGEAFQWKGSGEAGRRYTIEASTDLQNWREMGRVVAEGGAFHLDFDDATSNLDQFFLRIR